MAWSPTDLCIILEASAKAGVRTLKFAGLELEFGVAPAPEPIAPITPTAEIAEPNHVQQTRESVEMDELALREDRIKELLLTDPLEAEQLIAEGELADERSDEFDDDQEDA